MEFREANRRQLREHGVDGPQAEEAIGQGIARASETVHGIKGAWVKEQKVLVADGNVNGYRVDLKVSFVLD